MYFFQVDYRIFLQIAAHVLDVMFIRQLLKPLVHVLKAGQQCACCGQSCGGDGMCRECLYDLARTAVQPVSRCRFCGKILISEIAVCMECRTIPVIVSADRVFPLFMYDVWIRNSIFEWKGHGRRGLSSAFAFVMHEQLIRLGQRIPLVPVPPRPGKIYKTGWDQIADLCRTLARQYGHCVLPLLRCVSAVEQKNLGRQHRLAAGAGRYRLKSRRVIRRMIHGALPETAVLIDDVITTGATVEHCARLLKELGVRTVYVAAICRVV